MRRCDDMLARFVADNMSQSGLDNLAWKVGNISGPVTKAGAEAVNCRIIDFHPA